MGRALTDLLGFRSDIEVLATDVDTLDITDAGAVARAVERFRPDYIVNAAAYTAVDKAESDAATARLLNVDAVRNLAEAAKASGARLIHISTDYVFSGEATKPYKEESATGPRSVYGTTKLAGEVAALQILPKGTVILRTAWLYSLTGKNFVHTMLTLAASRDEIGVVADQWGAPTYAPVLARGIEAVIDSKKWHPGVYHFTGQGRTTWFDFTREIFRRAGVEKCRVVPITTEQYPTPARRPAYSVLDCSKFMKTFDFRIPAWQDSLHEYFTEINN